MASLGLHKDINDRLAQELGLASNVNLASSICSVLIAQQGLEIR